MLIYSQSGTQFHVWLEWINVYNSHFHQVHLVTRQNKAGEYPLCVGSGSS